MKKMASKEGGINGLLDPVEPGLACGSDTAHMSILGYNPRRLGAGPIPRKITLFVNLANRMSKI